MAQDLAGRQVGYRMGGWEESYEKRPAEWMAGNIAMRNGPPGTFRMRPGREESLNGPTLPLLKNKAPSRKKKYNIIHTNMLLILIFQNSTNRTIQNLMQCKITYKL